jgi:hypothetical protein
VVSTENVSGRAAGLRSPSRSRHEPAWSSQVEEGPFIVGYAGLDPYQILRCLRFKDFAAKYKMLFFFS